MSGLENIIGGSTPLPLEDLVDSSAKEVALNSKDRAHLASMAATLSEGDIVRDFTSIQAELSLGESETLNNIIQDRVFRDKAKNEEALNSFISSPDVPLQLREEAARQWQEGVHPLQEAKTSPILVAEKTLAEDSDGNDEQELLRMDLGTVLDEVIEYNQYINNLINSEATHDDPNTARTLVEFAELMVPFTEGTQVGQVLREFRESTTGEESGKLKGLLLSGSAKMELREAMSKLPIEQRKEMSKVLWDIMVQHQGVLFTDENKMFAADFMRSVFLEGEYDTVDKWIDNAISILDATIIGGPIAKAIKGAGTAIKGAKAGKKADKISATQEAIRSLEPKKAVADDSLADEVVEFEEGHVNITTDGEFVQIDQIKNREKVNAGKNGGSRARRQNVTTDVSPVSVSQTLKDTNPDKARQIHELAAKSDEVAQAAYGTKPVEAMANDLLPKPANIDGVVNSRPANMDKLDVMEHVDPDIWNFQINDGAIYYTQNEKRAMESRVATDFQNATGLTYNDSVSSIEKVANGVKINAVYSTSNSGYGSPQALLSIARDALRGRGIKDDNITLLRKIGGRYVPVSKTSTEIGDYNLSVRYDYRFTPNDVESWDNLSTSRLNIFDTLSPFNGRLAQHSGSFTRHLFDPNSLLDPHLSKGAAVAVDKATGMEKTLADMGRVFSKGYASLNKESRMRVYEWIKRANAQGLEGTITQLKAAGIVDPKEIKAIDDWRKIWDNIYWLENRDLVKTLRSRGFMNYTDKGSDTRLFAKPLGKGSIKGSEVKYYNPETDTIQILNRAELDELYDVKKGQMARLRQPIQVGDEVAEFVLDEGNKLRALTDDDMVLNYRKGYYQVQYKDPWFITKEVVDSSGRTLYKKAIASAGTRADAQRMVERMSAVDQKSVYDFRAGRNERTGDDYWDVQVSGGRTAQRVRGKRLEDANSNVTDPNFEHILDPVEALTKSVRSIARRTGLRDYLEAYKARFMAQYKEVLPLDDFGQPKFPDNLGQLDPQGQLSEKKILRDARTNFEYIKMLENGYADAIDDSYKAIMNSVSNIMGDVGLNRVSSGLRDMAKAGPQQQAKNLSFKGYLAANPLRQQVVQSHQAIRLSFMFPKYMTTKYLPQLSAMVWASRTGQAPKALLKAAGWTEEEFAQVIKDFKRSGLGAAVDANNLVRGDLQKLADVSLAEKGLGIAGKPLKWSQIIGFDAGEWVNITSAWLAFRNDAVVKHGSKFGADIADEVHAAARSYTYGMNMAGDMPFNQNAMRVILQFMQVPQKAFLQYTNRNYTLAQKIRLGVLDSAMWGVPLIGVGAPFYSMIANDLPENEATREIILNGFEDYMLNSAIESVTGVKSDIDFSSLAPNDLHGLGTTIFSMFTTDLGTIIAESPSGQLFFGGNPRITNAMKDAARLMNYDPSLHATPTDLSTTAIEFSKIASGMSNFFKMKLALEYGQIRNGAGHIVDDNVTSVEALALLWGFSTKDAKKMREMNNQIYNDSKSLKDDVEKMFKEAERQLSQKDLTPEQVRAQIKLLNFGALAWKDIPRAKEIWGNLVKKSAKSKKEILVRRIMEHHEIIGLDSIDAIVRDSGLDEESRDRLLNIMDLMRKARDIE